MTLPFFSPVLMFKIGNNGLLFRVSVLEFKIAVKVFKILPGRIGLPSPVLSVCEDFIIGVYLLNLDHRCPSMIYSQHIPNREYVIAM